jgi:hypothetical protein
VRYESDYVLRLIEQMGALMRAAFELTRGGSEGESPYDYTQQAIGLALDIDPALAVRLSPQSLASLIEMGNLDERVIRLVAEALTLEGEYLDHQGELMEGDVRRLQARAVLGLLDANHAN